MAIDEQTIAEKIKNASAVYRLKDHQIEGLRFLIKSFNANHGCILADEMGLGKTCQAVSFLVYLSTVSKSEEKYLILCPLSVLQHWKTEIERFGCGMNFVVYQGVKEDRVELRRTIRATKNDWEIILTTYEMALKDKEFFVKWTWATVVVDEGHRLKNSESLLHQDLLELNVKSFLMLTGTPVQNNLDELYSLLSLIDKTKFPPSKRQGVEELRKILEEYMLRRTKDVVCPDIPEKSEVILFHGLSEMQKKLYKAILSKNRDIFINSSKNKQKLMNTLMQLRKCVDHPYLFDGMEPEPFEEGDHLIKNCGKMIVLDCLLGYLFKHEHRVLIFSQMTRMLDIVQDYLSYKGYSYERLDGSVRGEERYAAINRFSTGKGTFCFLLSTKAGGLGLTLTAADTVVFIDSDFNPQNDLQAAARAHRIGQDRPVKILRLIARHSVEEYILKRAGQKLQLTNAILKNENEENSDQLTAAEISEMLMFGLSQLGETTKGDDVNFNENQLIKLIGSSKDGKWQTLTKLSKGTSFDVSTEETGDLYDFEGKNYRKHKEDDQSALKDILGVDAEELPAAERQTKGKRSDLDCVPLGRPQPAKVLTAEELEQRRKRRAELAEQRKQRELENRKKRDEALKLQKQKVWDKFAYISANLPESEIVETEEEEKDETEEIVLSDEAEDSDKGVSTAEPIYIVGDVSHPKIRQEHERMDAIVVHCVDNSGSWGKGGVFDSLSARSPAVVDFYKKASKMDDLELGDVHVFPIDDVESRSGGHDFVALIVAQHYKNRNELKYNVLETALKRLGEYAVKNRCTVHLPRIGYGLAKFNWYGTERVIRKLLCRRHVPTYIYYFSRRCKQQTFRRQSSATPSPSPPAADADDLSTGGVKRSFIDRNHTGDDVTVVKKCRPTVNDEEVKETDLPLPTIFDGLKFCFYDINENVAKKLGRFVIAYAGQWTLDVNAAGLTHVVVENDLKDQAILDKVQELKIAIVKRNWLEQCVKYKKLLPVEV